MMEFADRVFLFVMLLLWVGFSLFYMSLIFKCCRNLFDDSWEKRGLHEIKQWNRCHGGYKTYSRVNDQILCDGDDQKTMQFKAVVSPRRNEHHRLESKSKTSKDFTSD